jgi:lysophospholipase L1-like esterase
MKKQKLFGQILVSLGILLTVSTASILKANPSPIKVVCIGDSITQGRGPHSKSGTPWPVVTGWRYDFWKLAVDDGVPIEFVGTMTDGFESTPDYPDYKGQQFKNMHEARWGWTTEGVLEKLKEVHTQWKADVALIYLGTNREALTDEEKQTDPDGIARTVKAMEGIVSLLRQDNPHTIILIQALPGVGARVSLDDGYRKMASELSTPDSKIVVVGPTADWQWDPKQPDSDTVDGCHPNKNGDFKLASDFWKILKPLLPSQ